jgi:hypothetical protein
LKALENKFCYLEQFLENIFRLQLFSGLYLLKSRDSSFFADFTKRPLSFVERGVARGHEKQYSQLAAIEKIN